MADPKTPGIIDEMDQWVNEHNKRYSDALKYPDGTPIPDTAPKALVELQNGAPPKQPADLPTFPGIPGSSEGAYNQSEGGAISSLINDISLPYLPGAPKQGPNFSPEGENYLPIGGPEGKEYWQRALIDYPAQISGGILSGGEAEAKKSEDLANFYQQEQARQAQEAAILQQRRLERQAEIEAKQKQLEQATQRYTNDLADTGKFWKSPGNVLSAIGAALVALGSDDHAIGFKLVNSMVSQDYENRRKLADMHLGELRSNIGAYRQLMGDKNLGDQLAYAENNRIAAIEVNRIGEQMGGPIAQAKAAAISGEFMRNYQIQMMELYSKMLYQKPQQQPKALTDAYLKGGKMYPGVGFTPFVPDAQKLSGGQSGGQTGGMTAGSMTSAGPMAAAVAQGAKAVAQGRPVASMEQEDALNKRYPGLADRARQERNNNVRDVLAQMGAPIPEGVDFGSMKSADIARWLVANGKDPKEFNLKTQTHKEKIGAQVQEISKQMVASGEPEAVSGLRALGTDMEIIKLTAKRKGVSVDDLLGTRYDQIFGAADVKKVQEFLQAGTPENVSEQDAANLRAAILSFKAGFAGIRSAYFSKLSGSAISPKEMELLSEVISSNQSWDSKIAFLRNAERQHQAKMDSILNGAPSATAALIYLSRSGLGNPGVVRSGISAPPPPVLRRNDLDNQSQEESKKSSVNIVKRASENLRKKVNESK